MLLLLFQALNVGRVSEFPELQLQGLRIGASVDDVQLWQIVVPKRKREELVFKGHFVQWHDVEFGSNLSAAEEILALVVQKRNALKNMIFTQVSDSILRKDCLFELQGCLWTSLLARGDVTKQINRDWNLD